MADTVTFYGWFRRRGNNTKARPGTLTASWADGNKGRYLPHGQLLARTDDGLQLVIRLEPEVFARLAAQMAAVQLQVEACDAVGGHGAEGEEDGQE